MAHEAGELILRYYQDSDLVVELKSHDSPVVVADREDEGVLLVRKAGEQLYRLEN